MKRRLVIISLVTIGLLLAVFVRFRSVFERSRQLNEMTNEIASLESSWSSLQISTQGLLLAHDPEMAFEQWKTALDRFDRRIHSLQTNALACRFREANPEYASAEEEMLRLWSGNKEQFIDLSDHLSFLFESTPPTLRTSGRPLLLWRDAEIVDDQAVYYHGTTLNMALAASDFNKDFQRSLLTAIGIISREVESDRGEISFTVVALLILSMTAIGVLALFSVRNYLAHQASFRSLTENTQDVVIRYDRNNRITLGNAALLRLLKIGETRIQGARGRELGIPETFNARTEAAVQKAFSTAQPQQELISWPTDSGALIFDCRAFPEFDTHRQVASVFVVARDVTERTRLEGQLRHSEKMRAVGQLAGGIAHDFNNQLVGVLGFSEIIAMRTKDEATRQYAQRVITSARRAASLVRQLLAFGRKGTDLSVPVSIHAALDEVVNILGHSIDKRIEIRQTQNARHYTTIGDPTQLQNAFLNVALNARDAMPNGGRLSFETLDVSLDDAFCKRHDWNVPAGPYVKVSITDSGCGMTKEVQQRIFEPFFTTKEVGKGTGMGLASVYGTIKNHQGAISVYSEPGRGTSFTIYLPSHELESEDETTTDYVAERRQHTGHILIVDDESSVCDLATDLLTELGYTVSTCADGEEGVKFYTANWSSIDLVILDMVMPRLSGRDAFNAMRAVNPSVRAILASGYSLDGDAIALQEQGILAVIDKPFRQVELAAKVAQALSAPRQAADGKNDPERRASGS